MCKKQHYNNDKEKAATAPTFLDTKAKRAKSTFTRAGVLNWEDSQTMSVSGWGVPSMTQRGGAVW